MLTIFVNVGEVLSSMCFPEFFRASTSDTNGFKRSSPFVVQRRVTLVFEIYVSFGKYVVPKVPKDVL